MLKEVTELLAGIGASGSFATHRSAPAGDLKLQVQGVGPVRLPVTPTTARKLCEAARPARHGLKDQTRLDPGVRDTWEIPKRRLSIDRPRWQKTLAPQLDRIRRGLGLPEGCRLKAELHNLLVYAPGQFFVTHQDSEKTNDMIGTLVVSLPSQFTGGAMVIEHHDEKVRIAGSDRQLTFIAFYADCHHEVRPIKQGYRVVLTYNLIVEGEATAPDAPAERVEALARRVREFFETHPPPRWKGDRQAPPDRLVYLLDHQYTQRGLAWNRLKGADAQRAAVLQDVARQLDCEILLALADAHETWSCEEEYPGYGSRWGWQYDDDEEDENENGNEGEPELTELIDSDVELRHWVGRDDGSGDRPRSMAGGVGAHELCYTKPSVELEPFESEHEGYMGNYGNTVDRWYHRAAVVLWPRERAFVIRAKDSPQWAMGEIARLLKAKNAPLASAQTQRLLPFWSQVAVRENRPRLLDRALQVAAQLENEQVAAALLEPFMLTNMTPKLAPRFVDLLDRYGREWCRRLLRQWMAEKEHYEPPEAHLSWLGAALPALCRSLCARGSSDGPWLARWVLTEQWSWMLAHMRQVHKHTASQEHVQEFSRLCKPMLALIESSRITDQADLRGQLIQCLAENTADLPMQARLRVLRAAHQRHQPQALRALELKPVHASCRQEIATRLEAPARAKDDWSITTPIRCSCRLCGTLVQYLRTPDKVRLEWPLAKEQRAHVHGTIDARDLPVRHTTRRTGRPFTLILEKTVALFEHDAAERRLWQSELAWLTETAGDFFQAEDH